MGEEKQMFKVGDVREGVDNSPPLLLSSHNLWIFSGVEKVQILTKMELLIQLDF